MEDAAAPPAESHDSAAPAENGGEGEVSLGDLRLVRRIKKEIRRDLAQQLCWFCSRTKVCRTPLPQLFFQIRIFCSESGSESRLEMLIFFKGRALIFFF